MQLIPLQPQYLMRQTIGVSFLRTRERDPNLLALLRCAAWRIAPIRLISPTSPSHGLTLDRFIAA